MFYMVGSLGHNFGASQHNYDSEEEVIFNVDVARLFEFIYTYHIKNGDNNFCIVLPPTVCHITHRSCDGH